MSDLVERLRDDPSVADCYEAAAEIKRLQDDKRRTLQLADERAKEVNELQKEIFELQIKFEKLEKEANELRAKIEQIYDIEMGRQGAVSEDDLNIKWDISR